MRTDGYEGIIFEKYIFFRVKVQCLWSVLRPSSRREGKAGAGKGGGGPRRGRSEGKISYFEGKISYFERKISYFEGKISYFEVYLWSTLPWICIFLSFLCVVAV